MEHYDFVWRVLRRSGLAPAAADDATQQVFLVVGRRVASDNDFRLAENFAQAIDNDGATIMDARASLTIFATVEAALKSCRTGQPVEVR